MTGIVIFNLHFEEIFSCRDEMKTTIENSKQCHRMYTWSTFWLTALLSPSNRSLFRKWIKEKKNCDSHRLNKTSFLLSHCLWLERERTKNERRKSNRRKELCVAPNVVMTSRIFHRFATSNSIDNWRRRSNWTSLFHFRVNNLPRNRTSKSLWLVSEASPSLEKNTIFSTASKQRKFFDCLFRVTTAMKVWTRRQ